jgi:hypothetical protein
VAGGEAFFRFTLEREQLVYLGALGSDMDTVLALYQGDCGGAPLRCEDDACGGDDGHFVDVLAAGSYLVAVKAKHPSDFGRVRLKFQHADRSSATVIEGPGIYAGDTSAATDDVTACVELDGGEVDADPGAVRGESPDDVYAVAACDSTLIASTCGTSAFRSLIEVRAGSLDQPARACGASGETCAGEALGATAEVSVSNGLSFIIVDGVNAADRGSYRLFVSY